MLRDRNNVTTSAQLLPYGVALLSTTLALGISLPLEPWIKPTPISPFFAALMVSAWYGGLGPGLVATVLSTLAINYCFVPPYYAWKFTEPGNIIRLSVFVMAALLISGLNESRRIALHREQTLRVASEAIQSEAQAAKERLETFLSSINDGFYVLDRNWCYTYVNDRYCEIAGRQRELLLGQNIWELFPDTIDTDFYVQFQQALSEQTPLQFEYLYTTWNRWFEYRVYPSSSGLTIFVVEITDRKRTEKALQASEERFRLVTQAVNGLVFDWNLQTDEVYRSEQLYEIIGVYPEDVPPTLTWWHERIHPDDLARLQPQAAQAFTGSNNLYESEYQVRHKDGYWIDVWERGCLIRDDHGQVIRVVGSTVDISDRKRTEAALRQSEERFRVSQELSLDAFTILNSVRDTTRAIVDFVWTYVNPKAAEILQHPANELVGQRLLAVLPSNPINSELFERYVRVVETGEPHDIEIVYSTDNITAWFRNMAVKLEDGVAIFFSDITERKQAEVEREQLLQQLTTERAQFEAVLRQMPAGVIIAQASSGKLILGNQQAEQIWRHPFLYLSDIDEYREYKGFHTDGRLYQPEEWPLARSLMTGEIVTQEEIRFLRGDGTQGVMEASSTPIYNQHGQITAGVVIFQDITQRKQAEAALQESERRFRRLVESNMFGVAFGNFTGGIHYANDYFLKMVGYSREEIESGRVQWMAITPTEFLPLDEKAAAELRNNGVATPFEKEYIRKDGTRVPILIGAALLQEPYDQQQEIIGFFIDLTERKQAEAERNQLLLQEQAAREAAESANRIKDEFLAVLSHELRSPLNPILGWAKLLQNGKLDEARTKQAIATIERNAKLQAELIEDLLDVSRILRGKLSLTVSPVNLASTIRAAIETVRLAAEAKSIRIEATLDAEVGQVLGDSTRLQQVAWNLLSNAVKFTPPRGRVEVKLSLASEYSSLTDEQPRANDQGQMIHDKFAQITVSDTGKGIAPDFLPYVFDYFRQADSATTRKFGGLGLGLAIVRHLVELHGGMVQVDSPGEGLGATFTVRLPLMPIQPTINQDAQLSESPLDLSGVKVLVVDDDTDSREFIAFLLKQAGAKVIATSCAHEAFTALTQSQPDVLVSDIGMPQMDGYMLMRQVRALSPEQGGEIPAIALTAYAGELDHQQALSVGFQKHIPKPVEPEELVRAIASLLKQSTAS